MGQLVLGFRSLLIKIAIFFVMAGLLAWVLGGALFPQPTMVILPGAGEVYWRVSSGGKIDGLLWTLIRDDEDPNHEMVVLITLGQGVKEEKISG